MAAPFLRLPPVARAALISCGSMAAGDCLCQCIRARELKINPQQTLRFGLVGLTLHGPFFYNAFRWLDARFGTAATLQKAVTKSVAGQVSIFPLYVCGFYSYMGLLEGLSPAQCLTKLQHAFPPTYATGCLFWPAANMANFMLVPPTHRVLFVNVAGLFWNTWLSYENATKGAVAAAPAASGAAGGGAAAGGSTSSKKAA